MTDIVERLRVPVKYHAETTAERLEAADEIERLRIEAKLWLDRAEALQRDFEATLNAPCPHCGERP